MNLQDSSSVVLQCLCLLVGVCSLISGETHYCATGTQHITAQTGVTGNKIITRRSGESNYRNNEQCAWIIDTESTYSRIQIYVEQTDLEWSPQSAICNNYDYVEIRAGGESFSPVIMSWCRDTEPFSVITNTSKAFIKFATNDRNKRSESGVVLNYTAFDMTPPDGSCPPGWHVGESTASCYKLYDSSLTFEAAQEVCRHQFSNLVSFQDEAEVEYVLDYLRSSLWSSEEVWIGLTDIKVDGDYMWLDGTPSTIEGRLLHPDSPNQYYNCIKMAVGTGNWDEDMCDAQVQSLIKHKFVCKRNVSGPTEVYLVPTARLEKGEEGTLPPKGFIIGGVITGFVILILIGLAIYRWYSRKTSEEASESEVHPAGSPEVRPLAPEQPSAPQEPPPAAYNPDTEKPPTYDQVLMEDAMENLVKQHPELQANPKS